MLSRQLVGRRAARLRPFLVLWAVLALLTAGADAQPPATSQPPATPAGAENDGSQELREQTIYIPYSKLKDVFEKEGRGVFLPYEKFQALWKAAQKQVEKATPERIPYDAVIREINSQASIGKQVVEVSATLQIDVLSKGWVTVPLRLKQSAIRSATIDGQPARIVFDAKSGYQLLLRNDADQPRAIQLLLEYSRAFQKSPGRSEVTFEPPQAPINRWTVKIPERDVAIAIEPLIAATRTDRQPGDATPPPGDETQLIAFVGAAPQVKLSWNPRAEGASGLTAFATVQVDQQVQIAKGVVRTSATLTYEISRAPLSRLELDVPPEFKVVNVYDRNIKRWNVAADAGRQRVSVELFEPVQGQQQLAIELEIFRDADEDSFTVAVPMIRALDVGRQQGFLVVDLEADLQGEAVRRVGLLQVDTSELPATRQKQAWDFAYRYGAVPYALEIRAEVIQPRISVAQLVQTRLSSNAINMDWMGRFKIEDAGVFQLRVDIPEGLQVRSVRGLALTKGMTAASVESHHRESNESTTLIVNLSKKAIGDVGLQISLYRPLQDPNLVTPTGKSVDIEIPIPRAHPADVVFATGAVSVLAPESLRVNPKTAEGIRAVAVTEAYQVIGTSPTNQGAATPILAYLFAEGPAKLVVAATRRQPQVTVKQVLHTSIEPGVVKYTARFFYSIRFSGVRAVRIDVPTSLAGSIHNATPTFRRSELTPTPMDVAEGYTAWQFSTDAEMIGERELRLTWEEKVDDLKIGASRDVVLPRLIPRDVDRASGQVLVSKAEGIDIEPSGTPSGLRPIDPEHDVDARARSAGIALAFEFVGDWSLQLTARRYEPAPVKLTAVERGVVRVVVLPRDRLSVQALFRVKSARQRLAIKVPPKAEFDAQPLKINGVPVTPERGAKSTIYVPLVSQDPDTPFVIEMRYGMEGRPDHIALPEFADDPAVQKVYLAVYLPPKMQLIGSAGDWSYESRRIRFPWEPESPDAQETEEALKDLVNWICHDQQQAYTSASSFPVGESQRFVYSTLRPPPSPAGDLRLTVAANVALQIAVIALLLAIGLPLLGRSLRLQLATLLIIGAVIALAGAFQLELLESLGRGVLPGGVMVLALIWAAGHAWRIGRVGLTAARHRRRETTLVAEPMEPPAAPAKEADESEDAEAPDNSSAGKSGSNDNGAQDQQEGGPHDANA